MGLFDHLSPTDVKEFQGEFRFLSNFWPAQINYDGISYPTVEHAFQAAKTLDFGKRWEISRLHTPKEAKHAGKRVTLRPDWNNAKDQIMTELIFLKFTRHPDLGAKLQATGSVELVEGNTWGDTYWGVCQGVGKNTLGCILMMVRARLHAQFQLSS